jgi:Mannosyl-glycoprotein endo-beta-N-acetylglucosaminidase
MRNPIRTAFLAATIAVNISAIAPSLSPKPPNTPTKSEAYITRFKDLAMFEQLSTNIPASIKLGQALLESEAGESELAMNANNHFGLKCKTCSEEDAYMKIDDDRNKKGELVYSKFARFDSPEASFAAHSDRLTGDARYWPLFNYDRTDYRSWAYGLKACGYATDRYYAEKLITIIERYDLHRFDKPSMLSLSDIAQNSAPQFPEDLTSTNVPYDSDPNVPRREIVQTTNLQNAEDVLAVNLPYNSDPNVVRQQFPRENAQKKAKERENRERKKAEEQKRVANNYRTESTFTTNEGEQMHFTLYEVTLEGENENTAAKSAPKKQKAVLSKPVQRKKNVRVSH